MARDRFAEYAPIRDYAAIGDGRTVALVARDGRIDWLALPALDSPPVFASLLDPGEGTFALAPVDDFTVERGYVPATNVLQTTFRTATGALRVTDALCVGAAGRLPWAELARRVECLDGEVAFRWSVQPGTRFRSARPWAVLRQGVPVLTLGDQHLGVVAHDVGTVETRAHAVHGEGRLRAGERGLVALVGADREPMLVPRREEVEQRVDATVEAWQRWSRGVRYDGRWGEEVLRSLLTLKLLLYAPTGAIAAAPTTSLPETVGGDRNYDYRYAWTRDSSFTVDALFRCGLQEEMHAALSWLLATISRTADDVHVFYTLRGEVAETCTEVPLRGYRDSRPVRSGNAAADQVQLGTFGDLVESVAMYVEDGNVLDERSASTLAGLADRVCDIWRERDSGIWELDDLQHYTISKIGCWVTLDRVVRLAEAGHIAAPHVERWRLERDDVRRWVERHCWSQDRRSYTFFAGSDELDASVLLAARTGFADPLGERFNATIDAVRRDLADGPLVYRYSRMRGKEGAFLACSFWLVDALARAGRLDEAEHLMGELLPLANDVGLYAEEMDPGTHELLGNFPQGLTHLALVNAAAQLSDARSG